jgi:hypothetical protein
VLGDHRVFEHLQVKQINLNLFADVERRFVEGDSHQRGRQQLHQECQQSYRVTFENQISNMW